MNVLQQRHPTNDCTECGADAAATSSPLHRSPCMLLRSTCPAEFADVFGSTVDKCYRLTHKNDIVPAVPASPL
jgi:hypothetical protein